MNFVTLHIYDKMLKIWLIYKTEVNFDPCVIVGISSRRDIL